MLLYSTMTEHDYCLLQLTHRAVFPGFIPPTFFNSLIAAIYTYRAAATPLHTGNDVTAPPPSTSGQRRSHYYAHEIVEWVRVDRVGCGDCRPSGSDVIAVDDELMTSDLQSLYHQVLVELLTQSSLIQVSLSLSLSLSLSDHRPWRRYVFY